jgi:hypothetical protein
MPDDPAAPRPEEPVEERVPATPEPAPRNRHRDRNGLSGIAAWLLVAIAAVGLLASTPPSAGPDEPVQQATAWYVSAHVLPPGPTETFPVPASVIVYPCFAGQPTATAICMPPRSTLQGTVDVSSIVNYPPPYYWVVGIGQRLAAIFGIQYADVGGRLASIVLNLGVLLLLSLYMRRRNPLWGRFLLLVSTPLAVFLGVVVNPSGWEITCAVAMAAALSEAAWSQRSINSEVWPKSTLVILALATLALCTARPLGFVWASGLAVSAITLAPSISRRVSLRVAFAVAPGIVVGLLWIFTHPATLPVQSTVATSPSTLPNLVNWFTQSLLWFPERLRQMFGVLGWLDTVEPEWLLLVNLVAWVAVLTRLPSIRKVAILGGVIGIVIVPSVIETIGWGVWPSWWQGRYSMPFALGFILLLLLRSGLLIPRTISIAAAISLLSLGVMVWVNAIRYGFGLTVLELPNSLGSPGINPARLELSAVLGLVLVVVSGYLLVQALRTKRDLRATPDQEALS